MAFRLGDMIDQTDCGSLSGMKREIACECWFTSDGRSIPRIIKVMDTEGMLHTIREIFVVSSEEKMYAGIATVEHLCDIRIRDRVERVKLVFTKENCRWVLVADF